jgi:hypothetical protein
MTIAEVCEAIGRAAHQARRTGRMYEATVLNQAAINLAQGDKEKREEYLDAYFRGYNK